MGLSLPGIAGPVAANLFSVGLEGEQTPDLARKVAVGVLQWMSSIEVKTVDRGFRGKGSGTQALLVSQMVLFQNLIAAADAEGVNGPDMPPVLLGFANGLAEAFATMTVKTQHPQVGRGSATASFKAPPAADALAIGFGSEAPVGIAGLIGKALDATFASLVIPISIVGPPSLSRGSGEGAGKIT